MVRIAVGGLMHESNTFAAARTDLAAFESGGLETGPGIAARWGEAHHEVGGFFEGASRLGFEAVPTLMGWATPAGPLTADAYQELTDRLVVGSMLGHQRQLAINETLAHVACLRWGRLIERRTRPDGVYEWYSTSDDELDVDRLLAASPSS